MQLQRIFTLLSSYLGRNKQCPNCTFNTVPISVFRPIREFYFSQCTFPSKFLVFGNVPS